MPDPNPAAMEFLLTRRSRPAKTLTTPVPDQDALMPILQAGLRTPDHGKLEPWRLIVLNRAALVRLSEALETRGKDTDLDPVKVSKGVQQFANAHLVVAVVSAPVSVPKVPHIEQTLSAGAVCLSLLNAALASGWGANWLTDWPAFDRVFLENSLGLSDYESIAGFIHLGTETSAPPERPRPDIAAKVSWVEE